VKLQRNLLGPTNQPCANTSNPRHNQMVNLQDLASQRRTCACTVLCMKRYANQGHPTNAPNLTHLQTCPPTMSPNQHFADKEFHYHFNMSDLDESEDGDLIAMHDLALRKAASLEALRAYSGCFVSGFLALQEPLPWTSPAATASSGSLSISTGSPRPDSDTLSRADVRELCDRSKSNWRSLKKLRSMARLSKK
jgi:hypothetical protein